MIIDIISDLHGHYPKLEGGDLLIVAGDLTSRDTQDQHMQFLSWIAQQQYKKKIWIAGNHDNYLEGTKFIPIKDLGLEYLCDSGTEFEGLKIWGSPWTAQFPRINPACCAFTVKYHDHTDEILEDYWKKIPEDTDILITHCPPHGIFDGIKKIKYSGRSNTIDHVGSKSLKDHVFNRINPRIHCFGHIHEEGESIMETMITLTSTITFVNASHVNEHYEPVNKPIRVIL
jgi:Icc-related predicted phosphoesterase